MFVPPRSWFSVSLNVASFPYDSIVDDDEDKDEWFRCSRRLTFVQLLTNKYKTRGNNQEDPWTSSCGET